MKNLILAKAEEKHLNSDDCFDDWQMLLGYLTDNYATQERFFRYYYNAFKNSLNDPYRERIPVKKIRWAPLQHVLTYWTFLNTSLKTIYPAS